MDLNNNKLILKNINKKKIFCCNCGKYGHKYAKCIEPITSLGIIAIKIMNNDKYDKFLTFLNSNLLFNLLKSNTTNNNILLKINSYFDELKFLIIRRKKTLGFIEFLRGRYDKNDINDYTKLFEQMTNEEINEIKNNKFEDIWHNMWDNSNKFLRNDYDESFEKYCFIKKNINFDTFLDNIKVKYNTPEWGFPKGRRIYLEKNINCACREFEEETSLKSSDYNVINNIPPINEVFYGTNNVLYKHIYYFALCKNSINVNIDKNNLNQIEEIGDIGFFNYNDCIQKIRSYHQERLNILNETFIFFSSIMSNNYNLDNLSTSELIIEKDNIANDTNDIDKESSYIVNEI